MLQKQNFENQNLEPEKLNALFIEGVRDKIQSLPFDIERAWRQSPSALLIPSVAPGRDVSVISKGKRGEKKGFSTKEGQARLLHDLASIELQAMELAFRSFIEYPQAPGEFREQMADLALSESRHLSMCLQQIEELGFQWGDWPVYLSFWNAVSKQDSLLDRLLIVHRYLEASGLDAGVSLLKKLAQSQAPFIEKAVKIITEEEVGHVAFGSRWYQKFCLDQKIDPDHDFRFRMQKLKINLPKRFEVIEPEVRKKAGFTDLEIQAALELREEFFKEKSEKARHRFHLSQKV